MLKERPECYLKSEYAWYEREIPSSRHGSELPPSARRFRSVGSAAIEYGCSCDPLGHAPAGTSERDIWALSAGWYAQITVGQSCPVSDVHSQLLLSGESNRGPILPTRNSACFQGFDWISRSACRRRGDLNNSPSRSSADEVGRQMIKWTDQLKMSHGMAREEHGKANGHQLSRHASSPEANISRQGAFRHVRQSPIDLA